MAFVWQMNREQERKEHSLTKWERGQYMKKMNVKFYQAVRQPEPVDDPWAYLFHDRVCARCQKPYQEKDNLGRFECWCHPGHLEQGVWTCCGRKHVHRAGQNPCETFFTPGCTRADHDDKHTHDYEHRLSHWLTAIPKRFVTQNQNVIQLFDDAVLKEVRVDKDGRRKVKQLIVNSAKAELRKRVFTRAPVFNRRKAVFKDISPTGKDKEYMLRDVYGHEIPVPLAALRNASPLMYEDPMIEQQREQREKALQYTRETEAVQRADGDWHRTLRERKSTSEYNSYVIVRRIQDHIEPRRDDVYQNTVGKYYRDKRIIDQVAGGGTFDYTAWYEDKPVDIQLNIDRAVKRLRVK